MSIKKLEREIANLKRQLKREETDLIDYMLEHELTECCLIDGYMARLVKRKKAGATENAVTVMLNDRLNEVISAKISANKLKIRKAQAAIIKAQAHLDTLLIDDEIISLRARIRDCQISSLKDRNASYNVKVSKR